MEELINLVSAKTGLPKDQATIAVKTVLQVLKSKLPAPIGSQIDAVLNNSTVVGAAATALDDGKIDGNDVSNLLGGFLGGKK